MIQFVDADANTPGAVHTWARIENVRTYTMKDDDKIYTHLVPDHYCHIKYRCVNCKTTFVHWYHREPQLMTAIKNANIPQNCVSN